MAAPTSDAGVQKNLAKGAPSTHGANPEYDKAFIAAIMWGRADSFEKKRWRRRLNVKGTACRARSRSGKMQWHPVLRGFLRPCVSRFKLPRRQHEFDRSKIVVRNLL